MTNELWEKRQTNEFVEINGTMHPYFCIVEKSHVLDSGHIYRVVADHLLEKEVDQIISDHNKAAAIDWLEEQFGCALVNDDNGHWAVTWNGMQNVVSGDEPQEVETTFFISANEWHNTVMEAIAFVQEDMESD